MFRYDRPQKGRFRQFNQLGAETIGEKDIYADIELINFAKSFVNEAGISDKSFKIHVNSLGDELSRKKYISELKNFFQDHKNELTSEHFFATNSVALELISNAVNSFVSHKSTPVIAPR